MSNGEQRLPAFNVCVAKVDQEIPVRRAFTQVGVGWMTKEGGIRIKIDLTIVLGSEDELYVFPKEVRS